MLSPRGFLAVSAVAILTLLAGCGSDDPSAGSGSCTYQQDGSAAKQVDPPPSNPDPAETLTLRTNRGDIGVKLNTQATPCTANSFTSLAKQGFFDGTACDRLTTAGIFVLQCGDPTASGGGGPGYRFPDELSGKERYTAGTLAMANAGPDTNGSQFFIVYVDSQLPPSYTVFGSVDAAGLQVVKSVAAAGSDNRNGPGDGAPNEKIVIESVDLTG